MKAAFHTLVGLSMIIAPNCHPTPTVTATQPEPVALESRQETTEPTPYPFKPSWRPEPYTHF